VHACPDENLKAVQTVTPGAGEIKPDAAHRAVLSLRPFLYTVHCRILQPSIGRLNTTAIASGDPGPE